MSIYCPLCGNCQIDADEKTSIEKNALVLKCTICNWKGAMDELVTIGEVKNKKRTELIDKMIKIKKI